VDELFQEVLFYFLHLIHAAYCYTLHDLWSVTSVYLSVCLLSLLVSAAVTAEPIEMSFDGQKAYL